MRRARSGGAGVICRNRTHLRNLSESVCLIGNTARLDNLANDFVALFQKLSFIHLQEHEPFHWLYHAANVLDVAQVALKRARARQIGATNGCIRGGKTKTFVVRM